MYRDPEVTRTEYDARGRRVSAADTLARGRAWIAEKRRRGGRTVRRSTVDVAGTIATIREEDRKVAEIVREVEKERHATAARELRSTDRTGLESIAIHEAGHAVVGFLDGAGIHDVRIRVETDEWTGRTRLVGGAYRARSDSKVTARCLLAGCEAQELSDLGIPVGSVKDEREAQEIAGTWKLDRHRAEARELVKRHVSAVNALATELFRHGYVDGDRAEEIVRRHVGRAAA